MQFVILVSICRSGYAYEGSFSLWKQTEEWIEVYGGGGGGEVLGKMDLEVGSMGWKPPSLLIGAVAFVHLFTNIYIYIYIESLISLLEEYHQLLGDDSMKTFVIDHNRSMWGTSSPPLPAFYFQRTSRLDVFVKFIPIVLPSKEAAKCTCKP